jgi:hypothetical protein
MTKKQNDRRMAAMFLKEVYRRAEHYADRLDPKRKRNYSDDPILAALDTLTKASSRALYTYSLGAWTDEDWAGES